MTVIAMRSVDTSQDAVPHATVLHGSLSAAGRYSMPDYSNCPTTQLMEILMLQIQIEETEWIKMFVLELLLP